MEYIIVPFLIYGVLQLAILIIAAPVWVVDRVWGFMFWRHDRQRIACSDPMLSENVPLLNAANVFTANPLKMLCGKIPLERMRIP